MSIDPLTSSAETEVKQHNEGVLRRGPDRMCYREFCARCDASEPFSPHDLRSRGLRVVAGSMVVCLTVWLARWKCRDCRYVFTDYPDFRTSL
jgi:hypothetical protein